MTSFEYVFCAAIAVAAREPAVTDPVTRAGIVALGRELEARLPRELPPGLLWDLGDDEPISPEDPLRHSKEKARALRRLKRPAILAAWAMEPRWWEPFFD